MPTDRQPLTRILMTADAVGGVWQYSVDLISALAKHGIAVLLANLGPSPSEEQKSEFRQLSNARLVEGDFALEWMQNPWREVDRSKDWLLDLEQQFRPDVVHLNGYALADAPWLAPVVSVAHSCVYSWWNAVHGCAAGTDRDEYHHRVSQGLRQAVAVVAPSRSMAESVILHYGVEREKASVIPNFSLAPVTATAVEKQPHMLAAGRMWDKAKNLVLLDSIASEVTWPVYVAGKSEVVPDSNSSIGSVHHLGPLSHSDLLRRMEQASIFVHPALYEPFGLAVLEAAISRCCLVLADIASFRELWGGAAVFLDPHDPEAWSRELNRLIADPIVREHLATKAFIRSKGFNSEASVSQYLDVYQSAMRYKRSGSGVAA